MTEREEFWTRVVVGAILASVLAFWGYLLCVALWYILLKGIGWGTLSQLVAWGFALMYCCILAFLLNKVLP